MTLTKHSSLYVPATGIWESVCGAGWKFEAFVNGDKIASEFARDEEQRIEKRDAIRRAFSGLAFYDKTSG